MTRRSLPRRGPGFHAALPLVALLAIGPLGGCLGRSPEVRLFTLGSQARLERSDRAPDLAVLVGPVRLPAVLERPQMVRRVGGGEIELDETHRWVGSFESNLIAAVAGNLRRQLGSVRVVGSPSSAPFPFDYEVRLHVDELIVDESNRLQVGIRWAIVPTGRRADASLDSFEREIPLESRSAEAVVAAHDRALAELAARLADALAGAPAGS